MKKAVPQNLTCWISGSSILLTIQFRNLHLRYLALQLYIQLSFRETIHCLYLANLIGIHHN